MMFTRFRGLVIGLWLLGVSHGSYGAVKGEPALPKIDAHKYREITSVLVSRNGKLISEGYWNGANPASMHNTRSATKTLVALSIGKAIEQGAIEDVATPAWSFFKSHEPFRFANRTKATITIRDLLTMSSALDCNDNNWDSPGNEEHMYPARRWLFFTLDLPTKSDYERNEEGFGPFSYCTAGSFLLGQIVEQAVGVPVDQYFSKAFQKPLGITTINWPRSPSDEVQTGGGAEMTSSDFLKLGELILNQGKHRGRQIINSAWIKEMTTPHVEANSQQSYGYQIWKRDFACGAEAVEGWYMSGNGGNKIIAIDQLQMAIVVTSTLYSTRGMHEQTTKLVEDEILAHQPECSVTTAT